MKKRISHIVVFLTLLICLILVLLDTPVAADVPLANEIITLPPDFADSLVVNIPTPTALAFTPDGRMLITAQIGKLAVFQNGALLPTPALDLSPKLCANRERGLLGVAVDPNFATNRFVYLYYTFDKAGTRACEYNTANSPVNRVARFKLSDENIVDPASEVVLIDNIPSPNGNHNGGDLHFGQGGALFISVGDGGCDYAKNSGCAGGNDAARDRNVLLGKILRITSNGNIPSSNPFQGEDSARCNITGRTEPGKWCQETYAWGLRNPFRIAFDPNAGDTRFFINDVGQNTWEEIDRGRKGADYGWNQREGSCATGSTTDCGPAPEGMTDPIYAYDHSAGCKSITGGAFIPADVWPAAYERAYLFSDYVCGKIFMLGRDNGVYTATEFATGLGTRSAITMLFGPYAASQSLYYTTYADSGQVRRIDYTGKLNRAPTAVALAQPTFGAVPLDVHFDASTSIDPDGDALTYSWDFGDGALDTLPTTTHTYTRADIFTATLRVTDSAGGTGTAIVRIDAGNTPPIPSIISPSTRTRFRVGQSITLQGSASDPEDGQLPDNSLSWRVILHHDTHTHPFLPSTNGNNIAIEAPAPEDLEAITNSYLEIELTATDSWGLTGVVTQTLRPRLVNVTFATEPTGLVLQVNDRTITAPETLVSWATYALSVDAQKQVDASGQLLEFVSWSDGGLSNHTIMTPSSTAIYTATFRPAGSSMVPTGQ